MGKKNKNRHPWKNPHLPTEGSRQIIGIQTEQSVAYSGPIPMASELAEYEKICPGSADRLIAMAEKQESHRHGLEASVISSNIRNERTGMHYAFFLTTVLMGLGAVLIFTEKDTAGYFALFGPAVFQGSNFIYHKTKERKMAKSQ